LLLLGRLELAGRLGRLEERCELPRSLLLLRLLRSDDFFEESAAINGAPQIPPIKAIESRTRNGRFNKLTGFWIIMTLPFWLNRNCPRFDVNDLREERKICQLCRFGVMQDQQ
tara:strand:+ start:382 stop:720 length:339 start_codon:yes stop_codon:yes gene_type:complete